MKEPKTHVDAYNVEEWESAVREPVTPLPTPIEILPTPRPSLLARLLPIRLLRFWASLSDPAEYELVRRRNEVKGKLRVIHPETMRVIWPEEDAGMTIEEMTKTKD